MHGARRSRNPTTRAPAQTRSAAADSEDQRGGGHPGRRWHHHTDAHTRRAAPVTSPISSGQQPRIEEARGDPPKTARTYLPQEGPPIMSPHSDRCVSKATVSPDQDQPDTAIATVSSCRPVFPSSKGSIRRVRRAHHRTQATVIICNREEQNHPLTDGVKGTAGNSRPGEVASSCQYWGRRRYGPVA
jgi:hypothetical protein